MKYFLSLFLYRVLFLVLLPLLLLALLIRSKNHPEYRLRLSERLGFISKRFSKNGVVLHAASVGEVIALKPFIEKILATNPTISLTITTFTPTGSAQVIKLFGDKVQHCYLPIDSFFCTTLFLYRLKPKVVVFMETEVWPNLIAQCKWKNIKLLLVNGRLSSKSVSSYSKLTWLITPSLNAFDKILTQSQVNQENFLQLGCNPQRCEMLGNLKFDISISDSLLKKQQELAKYINKSRQVWVVASTHQGDEAIALQAFKQVLKRDPNVLLVIVPRHPERFNEVAKLVANEGFIVQQRSEDKIVDDNTQVWVLDTLGELMPMCALSTVVTMGGSFSDIGGHNPLEPALFKKPVVVGNNMSNFTEIMQQLLSANGIIQVNESIAVGSIVSELLNNTEKRTLIGENAFKVVLQNQGASDRTLAHLQQLIYKNFNKSG